jgi:hypothetical protein
MRRDHRVGERAIEAVPGCPQSSGRLSKRFGHHINRGRLPGIGMSALSIEIGDREGTYFHLSVKVERGDRIYFQVDARGDPTYDTTYFDPKVNWGPDPCPSGDPNRCKMIALTYARSTDGGRTYAHPSPPDHLVATLPYRYRPDGGLYALWQPSNIVAHPSDGYYYALVQLARHPADEPVNVQGTCVMRTRTVGDPGSWRAWDGEGFNLAFINPYRQAVENSEAQTCTLVSVDEIGALTYCGSRSSSPSRPARARWSAAGEMVHRFTRWRL